ncbi:MAG: hypothetical protein UT34_C0002G0013 [candidate division WS6 bacterium GW2011_GWF2_39_15]|uniref:Uncharacterized protein n=1 Tax=candidate division WS6 bacterium GW2011_GWF2_39_15 TaxID=1619100 RepID=A0A0G0MY88_9BACT|nr:MAG: hypothetical protein UT34_C0002G0013 [candidate division WS6 bacterium GW2011_GWF2_39_15]
MKSIKQAFLLSLILWLVPFVVAFMIFPLRESDRPFFESIMPVTVVLTTMILSIVYFKGVGGRFLKEGIFLGLVFFLVNIGIDCLIFMKGPWAMSVGEYFKDIGLTYLVIPAITMGIGYILQKKSIQPEQGSVL